MGHAVNVTAHWDTPTFLYSQQPKDGNPLSILQPEPLIDKMLV